MDSRLAQVVVFTAACFLAESGPIHAQQVDTAVIPEAQGQSGCPNSSLSHRAQSSGPEISIDNVTFSGFLQMPASDQDEIAASIRQKIHADALDETIEEALGRARTGWQDRGYFKVQVSGNASTLTKNGANLHIALSVHVDEGLRYTLGGITFKHNRAISNVETLLSFFPIDEGETFSRAKLAKGLDNLRKAYSEYGYLNYTGVPSTTFDDQNKLAFLEIDVDEGKQFNVSIINVVGLDEIARQEVLHDLPIKPGQIYDSRLWQLSLRKYRPFLPDCECRSPQSPHLDQQAGTVVLTLDFRPCSHN